MVEIHIYCLGLFNIAEMETPTIIKIHIYPERHKSRNLCMNIDKAQLYYIVNFNNTYWSITQ